MEVFLIQRTMLFPRVICSVGRISVPRSLFSPLISRGFVQAPILAIKANKLPPRPKLGEDEIEEVFLKGGRGPGGQKVSDSFDFK